MNLVPNRECGECTICCKVLVIDEPDLQKLPGITCPNCKAGAGCQIYDTRPAVCRGFFCGWRVLPELREDWRPDRSGIIIRMMKEYIPPGLNPVGLRFLVVGRTDVIFSPGFVEYLGRLIMNRVAVFLSIRGPDGFSDVMVLLNDHLAPAVASRDRNKVVKILSDALDALSKNKFEPVVLKHGNPALSG